MEDILQRMQALQLRTQAAEDAAAQAPHALVQVQSTIQQLQQHQEASIAPAQVPPPPPLCQLPIVDTRQLGRPNKFQGKDLAEWRSRSQS